MKKNMHFRLVFPICACFAKQHFPKKIKNKMKDFVRPTPRAPQTGPMFTASAPFPTVAVGISRVHVAFFRAVWRLAELACDASGAYSISPPRRPIERPRLVLWTCQYYEVPSPDLTGLRVGGRAATPLAWTRTRRARTCTRARAFPSIPGYCFNETPLPTCTFARRLPTWLRNRSGFVLFLVSSRQLISTLMEADDSDEKKKSQNLEYS